MLKVSLKLNFKKFWVGPLAPFDKFRVSSGEGGARFCYSRIIGSFEGFIENQECRLKTLGFIDNKESIVNP